MQQNHNRNPEEEQEKERHEVSIKQLSLRYAAENHFAYRLLARTLGPNGA